MDKFSDVPSRSTGFHGAMRAALLFCGVLLLLVAVALPLLDGMDRHTLVVERIRATLDRTSGQLQILRQGLALRVEQVASLIAGIDPGHIDAVLKSAVANRPDLQFTVYNKRLEPKTFTGPAAHPPAEPPATDDEAGFIPFTGITGLDTGPGLYAGLGFGKNGDLLLATLPLNAAAVSRLETAADATLGILPLAPLPDERLGGLARTPAMAITQEQAGALLSGGKESAIMEAGGRATAVTALADASCRPVALLFAAPSSGSPALPSGFGPATSIILALLGLAALYLWHATQKQALAETVNESLKDVMEAEINSLPEPPHTLPPELRATFGMLADTLATRKDLARSVVQRLTEVGRSQGAECPDPSAQDRSVLNRYYDSAVNGIYQCDPRGRLLRVNLPFALMLGYDSSLQLLAERATMADLFTVPDEAGRVLAGLREDPGRHQSVILRLHDGKSRPFRLTALPGTGGENEPLEGFLIDREPELLLEKARQERDLAVERHDALALLLASTCLQTQAYFAPRLRREGAQPAGPEPLQPGHERRRSINSLQGVFDDIYRIAMAEAQDVSPVMVPIDLYRLMDKVYHQALPAMAGKDIDLILDVAPDIRQKVSGSEALLGHTLLRGLFMITASIRGGSAILGLTRDPYTEPAPGTMRLIFSASWVPNMDLPEEQTAEASEADLRVADKAMTAPAMSPLEGRDEWAVIAYLVERMQGRPLGTALSRNARAVQYVVQLETRDAPATTEPSAGPTEEPAIAPEEVQLAAVEAEEEAFHEDSGSEAFSLLVAPEETVEMAEAETDLPESPGLDILLVDDSPNTRMLFSLYLKNTRHRISEAYNGREGVEAAGSRRFDIIFMDLEMPLMDGYQATRIIRAMEADAGRTPTPIVAVTGYTLPEARRECMAAGCTEFLAKPFSKNALLSMIAAITTTKGN